MRKSSYPWFFAVVILSVLLVITFILGYTGYFFSLSFLSSNTDLTLGENVLVSLKANETSVVSFTFDGSILPNEKLEEVIQIKGDIEKDVKVRVKAEVFYADEKLNLDIVTTDDFVYGDDGYFYLNNILSAGNKVTFSKFIVMPKDAKFDSSKKYILSIIVENLDATFDIDKIWEINKEII